MRLLVVAAVACACASVLGVAPADADAPSTDTQAHQAYERGTAAYRRKDYATAAREYAAADALSPNPVALQAAIDAAVQADDPVLGRQLLDRAATAPRSGTLASTMAVAEQKFAHRTGRIAVTCVAQPCLATVDGAAVDPAQPVIVRIGSHTVLVDAGGATTTRTVTVGADETVAVGSSAPAPASAPPPAAAALPSPAPNPFPSPAPALAPAPADSPPATPSGLPPLWFFLGLGATVVVGGATVASGVDTANQASTFGPRCRSAQPAPDCPQLQSSGQSAQTRTNVLLGVTAALGIATVVLIPFTRWHGMTAGVTSGGLAFDARF